MRPDWYMQVRKFFEQLILSDFRWARMRRWAALTLILAFYLAGSLLFELPYTAAIAERWQVGSFALSIVPKFVLQLVAMFISGETLRYLIPPFGAIIMAILIGAVYLQDIYELPSYRMALSYLWSSLFGFHYAGLVVLKGQVQRDPEHPSTLDLIGGPGIADVNPGNALVLETLEGDIRICPEGNQLIHRFETIRDVAYLKDYEGVIDEISAFSQDGIRILVRGVRYRYRIRFQASREKPAYRSEENPYPFADSAVLNMAANRIVGADGLLSWQDTVQRIIRGTIVRHINTNPIDYLTAPRIKNLDPRGDLLRNFFSPQVGQHLEECGAELLWIDIGYFDIPEEVVDQQRLEAWRTRWLADANLLRAYGDARRSAYQELGRTEAQAEMLMSIAHALDDIGASADHEENLRKLILMRTTQILEAMNEPGNGEASANPAESSQ